MNALRGRHVGQTATIIGCGRSILHLRPSQVPPGPVIALNHAILPVRALHLPNRVYSMQKDGCIVHDANAQVPITDCLCPWSPEMVWPLPPEELIVSRAESSHCFAPYRWRHVLDVESLGVPWWTPSTPVAVQVAHLMGCTSLVMLGHDARTVGDIERVGGSAVERNSDYLDHANQADGVAGQLGMAIDWRAP